VRVQWYRGAEYELLSRSRRRTPKRVWTRPFCLRGTGRPAAPYPFQSAFLQGVASAYYTLSNRELLLAFIALPSTYEHPMSRLGIMHSLFYVWHTLSSDDMAMLKHCFELRKLKATNLNRDHERYG